VNCIFNQKNLGLKGSTGGKRKIVETKIFRKVRQGGTQKVCGGRIHAQKKLEVGGGEKEGNDKNLIFERKEGRTGEGSKSSRG